MIFRPFIILSIFLFSFGAAAQNSSNKAYHRMEGTIGDDIEVTANFIRLFDNIKGNYQYKFKDDDATMFYGKMLEFEGKLLKNDSLYLLEYGSEKPSIKGVWNDNSFTGEWKVPDEKNDYMDVLLKEYYPSGSLQFDLFYFNSEENLVSKDVDSPKATLELTFIYPKKNFLNPGILDSIRRIINKGFFGNNFIQATPAKMLADFENEYYHNYKTANLELYKKMDGASLSWASLNNMSVLFNSDYLLCVEYEKYAYTGGAHGITNDSYDIIDLKNGKTLTYNDIFVDNADSALSAILTAHMLKKYRTEKAASLKQLGFFTDKILPNQNIYVTGNGIGFKYASYEVAPYSYGLPEVFINFDEIKQLIRPGTPIYRLSRQKQQ